MKEKMSHTMISLDGRNSKLPDHKIYKMMRHALFIAKENRACHSRQIGSVICDEDCKILSVGYNGPPKNTPHTLQFGKHLSGWLFYPLVFAPVLPASGRTFHPLSSSPQTSPLSSRMEPSVQIPCQICRQQ